MTMMTYKGYEAAVEYDEDAEIFHGEVINLRDVITFQGRSVSELKKAFAGSVEDYLAFCKARGEDPEKPFSGQFVVRAEPSLHRAMFSAAKRAGMSLNKWVTSTLERAVSRQGGA
jgi:predicted HicB family RNase H-like nuclease